ncbi:hypothetical protein ACKN7S_16810 [Bradyrhizobium sp. RDM4]
MDSGLAAPAHRGRERRAFVHPARHRHHAILPVFCPTEQMIIFAFPELKKTSMISA